MKRKIYEKLLDWKIRYAHKYALLIEGARRVGKSYIVGEFAKTEYERHLIIDFAKASPAVKKIFEDYLDDLVSLIQDMSLEPEIAEFCISDSTREHELIREALIGLETKHRRYIFRWPFFSPSSIMESTIITDRYITLHKRIIRIQFVLLGIHDPIYIIITRSILFCILYIINPYRFSEFKLIKSMTQINDKFIWDRYCPILFAKDWVYTVFIYFTCCGSFDCILFYSVFSDLWVEFF